MRLLLVYIVSIVLLGVSMPAYAQLATPTPAVPVPTTPAERSVMDSIYSNLRLFGFYSGLGDGDIRVIIARLIRAALGFIGIVCIVLVLLAGFTIMVSGGDDERMAEGKKSLVNAVIGLAVILLSYSIVTFIIVSFTTVDTGTPPTNTPVL